MPRIERGASWYGCAWALACFLVLAIAWERLAAGHAAEARGMVRYGQAFVRAGGDLALVLRKLTPPEAPRIAVFGSSQIATVKDAGASPELSMPAELSATLARRGVPHEVIDFSAGGQQVSESMIVLMLAGEAARPRVVLLGLSLFSMLRVEVRETLLAGVDVPALRAQVVAALPANLPREQVEELLEFSRKAPQRVVGHGETWQQRSDRWIASHLEGRFAAVANRQVLYDELLDTPLRRDLVSFLKRTTAATRTARSYRIGRAYEPSLAALEVMARWCREHAASLQVVLLPFDHRRPPVPFSSETVERLREDLAGLAASQGFRFADRSDLLGSAHFRDFVDGSPDNLHFDAAGHALLGESLADLVAPELAPPPPARAAP